ncbi:MAG TPA: class I SAM-dependent methyltransferase [Sphingomonas sp.]
MNRVVAALGAQLAKPHGVAGGLVNRVMRIANRRSTRLAVEALGPVDGQTILDLGCGSGDAVGVLERHARDVSIIGIDHAPMAIADARRRFPRHRFDVAAFEDLPIADQAVDCVLASNVAYFWRDDRRVLAEIRRVVRPGGRLALYVTDGAVLARCGLDRAGTHRLLFRRDLEAMLGQDCTTTRVDAGFGVDGWLAVMIC